MQDCLMLPVHAIHPSHCHKVTSILLQTPWIPSFSFSVNDKTISGIAQQSSSHSIRGFWQLGFLPRSFSCLLLYLPTVYFLCSSFDIFLQETVPPYTIQTYPNLPAKGQIPIYIEPTRRIRMSQIWWTWIPRYLR